MKRRTVILLVFAILATAVGVVLTLLSKEGTTPQSIFTRTIEPQRTQNTLNENLSDTEVSDIAFTDEYTGIQELPKELPSYSYTTNRISATIAMQELATILDLEPRNGDWVNTSTSGLMTFIQPFNRVQYNINLLLKPDLITRGEAPTPERALAALERITAQTTYFQNYTILRDTAFLKISAQEFLESTPDDADVTSIHVLPNVVNGYPYLSNDTPRIKALVAGNGTLVRLEMEMVEAHTEVLETHQLVTFSAAEKALLAGEGTIINATQAGFTINTTPELFNKVDITSAQIMYVQESESFLVPYYVFYGSTQANGDPTTLILGIRAIRS